MKESKKGVLKFLKKILGLKSEKNNTKEEMVECPYHKGEFYPPWSYCERCYIEEKE